MTVIETSISAALIIGGTGLLGMGIKALLSKNGKVKNCRYVKQEDCHFAQGLIRGDIAGLKKDMSSNQTKTDNNFNALNGRIDKLFEKK